MTNHYICCTECKVRLLAGQGYGVPEIVGKDDLGEFLQEHMKHPLVWIDDNELDANESYDVFREVERSMT